jgi:hypothetical protein
MKNPAERKGMRQENSVTRALEQFQIRVLKCGKETKRI